MQVLNKVISATQDNITTLTLNRPEVRNAFDEGLIQELTEVFEKAGADSSVRAVVLRGSGESFCAGGDLQWMRRVAGYSFEDNVKDAGQLAYLLEVIESLSKPTLALIQGHAFGGGIGLAACCDIVLAEETAVFSLSEVRVGLIPSIIAPYVMSAIGPRQARRYFLTGERFDAQTAKMLGLVHEVVKPGGLQAAAETFLKEILMGAPGAQSQGKALIRDLAFRTPDSEVVHLTVQRIAEVRASDEGRAGIDAFLNKQRPPW